ncbi:unnamed protein product [Clavelina lepadiformis]|uniref:Pseudouridine synthase I TruA alpha/beta domain-containing protein n=1 Tax=Clavelina lepadiformis TaxID=159417 RepID=A0ABP0H4Z1_CLALP
MQLVKILSVLLSKPKLSLRKRGFSINKYLCLHRCIFAEASFSTSGFSHQKMADMPLQNETEKDEQDKSESKHGLLPGPKRKVALLLAYCGENYFGMAMNRGDRERKTIEGSLIRALVDAKLVPENCWDHPNKMSYKVASRTDKGVSTCGQVVSLKMVFHENAAELINEKLPHDIRVLGVKRTTQGFSAQYWAGARTYSYTLPTYAFASSDEEKPQYRISPEKLKSIQSFLYRYKGTHSYHNFTSGKRMGDMSAHRYIMEFEHETPFLQHDIEFMTLKLKGQSFMIHQIRKMVGLMIAIVGDHAEEHYFNMAFSEPLVDIPKAPGTGLVLERVHYDTYNKKFSHLHGGIDFSEVESEVEQFRQTRILPYIYLSEVEEEGMMEWLPTLSCHDFTGERAREDWKKMNEKKNALESNGDVDASAQEKLDNQDFNANDDFSNTNLKQTHTDLKRKIDQKEDTSISKMFEPAEKKARNDIIDVNEES